MDIGLTFPMFKATKPEAKNVVSARERRPGEQMGADPYFRKLEALGRECAVHMCPFHLWRLGGVCLSTAFMLKLKPQTMPFRRGDLRDDLVMSVTVSYLGKGLKEDTLDPSVPLAGEDIALVHLDAAA